VSQELEKLSAKSAKAKAAYLRGLLKALFTFHAPNCTVRVGQNEIFKGRALAVTAAKGQFFGNGMHISPNALPANGLFDFTIVQKVPNWKIFPQLPKLFSGKLDSASFVQKSEGRLLEIQAEFAMPVQADGEFVGEANVVSFQVLPQAINVIT
jgi:diacylglycerol kinase family enzyme